MEVYLGTDPEISQCSFLKHNHYNDLEDIEGQGVALATNERELLAITLTFAVSDSNPNAKTKRWKARIDESQYIAIYTHLR